MRPRFLWPAATAALAVISSSIAAQAPATFSPLDVRVSVSPRPLVAAGQTHIAYEVHITNMASRAATLDLVEVRDRSSKPGATPLLRLEGDVLDGALLRFGAQPNDGDRRLLAAGQTSVLCVWLSVGSDRVPRQLTHHVVVRLPTAAGTGTNSISVDGFDVAVVRGTPRVIGPPLGGTTGLRRMDRTTAPGIGAHSCH